MTTIAQPLNLNPQIVLTQLQYEALLRRVRSADLQRSYIKKYHQSAKGKVAKKRAQRRYRAKKKAIRIANIQAIEVELEPVDVTNNIVAGGGATLVLNED